MIYIIGGKARSGKDTFANILEKNLQKKGKKTVQIKITDTLYRYIEKYFKYDLVKNDKPRELLQKLGIELIKNKLGKKTFLLDRTKEDIEILSNFFDTFIITDMRLKDEINYFRDNFNDIKTIKIERLNYEPNLTETEKKHITEIDFDNYNDFDYIIENNLINNLEKKAKEIVEEDI